jgi:hypothetical protein
MFTGEREQELLSDDLERIRRQAREPDVERVRAGRVREEREEAEWLFVRYMSSSDPDRW